MDRFIVEYIKIFTMRCFKFKIQYGQIYSLIRKSNKVDYKYLKSNMDRFIAQIRVILPVGFVI